MGEQTGSPRWRQKLGQAPGYKWTVVATLFLVGALNYADRTVITAVFPLLRAELLMSDMALGALGSLFLWSYALVSPVAGLVGDRLPRTSLIVWSLTGWSLVTGISGTVASSGQLLGMRVLLGLAEALYLPSALALLACYHGPETRGKATALHAISLHAGQVAGGTLGGFLGELIGWRVCLYTLGSAGLVLAAATRLLLLEPPKSEGPGKGPAPGMSPLIVGGIGDVLRNRSYQVILGQAMAIAFGVWIFVNWLPLYFHETFGMTLTRSGFFGTILIRVGSALGLLTGGCLSDLAAKKGAHRRGLLQAISFALSAPPLLAFACSGDLGVVSGAIVLHGFLLTAGQAGEMPLLTELVHPKYWSTAAGLYNMSACLAGGAGILAAGYLKRELSLGSVFAGVGAIVLLASLLVFAGYLFFFRRDMEHLAQQKAGIADSAVGGVQAT